VDVYGDHPPKLSSCFINVEIVEACGSNHTSDNSPLEERRVYTMGLATKKPHEGLLIVYDQGEGHLLEKLPLQSDDR